MSQELDQQDVANEEERPENLTKETWLTLILFAGLIVGLSICAPVWMFN
ncbi:MAG: hypothetical protein KF916_06910 [Microbacteriaceae bacterium]|nr:hypothetical protein [Microbacteriaceae bacterium]